MNTERLTTKSRDALTAAVRQALTNGNPNTEPEHLLHGLLLPPDNTVGTLLEATGADAAAVDAAAVAAIGKLPSTTGSSVTQPALSGSFARVLATAETLADELGDDFVATEHLLIALARVVSAAQTVLTKAGVKADALLEHFSAARGGKRVTSAAPRRSTSPRRGCTTPGEACALNGAGCRGVWSARSTGCASPPSR